MLFIVNALLYVFALTLAVAVTSPPAGVAVPGLRAARAVLAFGGGLTITAAIALGIIGLWFESALAGTAAIVVVGTSMWFACPRVPARDEDEEDEEDDDGGSLFDPPAPEPTRPEGGPSDDFWTEFDAARAGWARDRERTSV